MADRERCVPQGFPGVGIQPSGQFGRIRRLDHGARVHAGLRVVAVDVEEVTGVAEGVVDGGGRGQGIHLDAEPHQPLVPVLDRPQPEQHHRPPYRPVVLE